MHIKPLMTHPVMYLGRLRYKAVECDQFRFMNAPSVLMGDTRAEAVKNYKRFAYGIRWRNLANQARRRK